MLLRFLQGRLRAGSLHWSIRVQALNRELDTPPSSRSHGSADLAELSAYERDANEGRE